MKIMAVSDLHGSLEGLDPRGADVVVVAGDLAPMKGWGVWHVNDQRTWRTSATRILHPAPPAARPNFLFRRQSAALPRASYRR